MFRRPNSIPVTAPASKLGFEGVVSKTIDAPYTPGNRGLWRKAKALYREEFVVVGWSDPEGTRPYLGALLLGYHSDDGKLIYAGRMGTGMPVKVLADLRRRLDLLARKTSPLSVPPPRCTRFGSPLVLSRVHWVEPKVVAEITYLTWTADNLLRHPVYVGLREDKPAEQVRREAGRVRWIRLATRELRLRADSRPTGAAGEHLLPAVKPPFPNGRRRRIEQIEWCLVADGTEGRPLHASRQKGWTSDGLASPERFPAVNDQRHLAAPSQRACLVKMSGRDGRHEPVRSGR
jgi:hypothetical protein